MPATAATPQAPMDRNLDEPASRFARQILSAHPQISYEHAVSAAEYAGVHRLPRAVFFAAAARLGIDRQDRPAADEALSEVAPSGQARSDDLASRLDTQIEQARQLLAHTAQLRDALTRMREVVRATLDGEAD